MEFASDARPLIDPCFQPCVELPRQLPQSQMIERPQRNQKRRHAGQLEPSGLVVGRRDGKIQRIPRLVPHSTVIASHHPEAVLAWTKIGIERLPPRPRVLPVAIPTFQLHAEVHLFRHHQAQRGVINRQVAHQRRQLRGRGGCITVGALPVSLAVRDDLLDVHRGRKFVEGKVTRIDDADAVARQEPDPSIRRLSHERRVSTSHGMAPHTIRSVERFGFYEFARIGDPSVQFGLGDAHQAAAHVEPHGVVVIFHGSEDVVAGQSVFACKRDHVTVFNATQSSICSSPECPLSSKAKIIHVPCAQPVFGRVRSPDGAVY